METESPPPPLLPSQPIKLYVGGKLFETTTATLNSTGPNSLLSSLSSSNTNNNPIFIDRDPDLFAPLLSLLRTGRLPSSSLPRFSRRHLLHESLFYGLHLPTSSLSLSPFDASLSSSLFPPSDPFVSALSFSDPQSCLLLAHGGLLSSYSSDLFLESTTRTHLDYVSSVLSVSLGVAVVGSESSPGLHFYSTSTRKHAGSTLWIDPSDPRTSKARVASIAAGSELSNSVFASFECWHGENAVLVIDKATAKPVSEIGRQSGNAAKSAAIRKLTWIPSVGLLVGSSIKYGSLGYSGYIRVWDPRAGGAEVWETSDPGGSGRISRAGDTMADVDVDPDGLFVAKVGSRSGDLGVADLRRLGPDPWVYLEDPNPRPRRATVGGERIVLGCYQKHVFVGRDGGLEAWSRLNKEGGEMEEGKGGEWGFYRRNYVNKEEDEKRGVIRKIECGGNRVFVCRENVEGVEVWESSNFSVAKVTL